MISGVELGGGVYLSFIKDEKRGGKKTAAHLKVLFGLLSHFLKKSGYKVSLSAQLICHCFCSPISQPILWYSVLTVVHLGAFCT